VRSPRSAGARLAALALVALLLFAAFCALGSWQLQRRAWKLDLIARVEQRVQASPLPAPGPAAWAVIDKRDEYRPVHVEGVFLHERETLVQAVTKLGPGYWVVTPLRTAAGYSVLINRGFVAPGQLGGDTWRRGEPAGEVRITGLLRLSEPGGGFLRRNDPLSRRWYSRDVAAIADSQRLPPGAFAPYFVDADAAADSGGGPQGGLTVLQFRNNHLVYALTWYSLALMTLGGRRIMFRQKRLVRRQPGAARHR